MSAAGDTQAMRVSSEDPAQVTVPSRTRPPLRRARRLWLLLGLSFGWTMLMRKFGGTDVYSLLGPYACVVVLACVSQSRESLAELFRPSLRVCLWGVGFGTFMTLATYPAYELSAQVFPALRGTVRALYSDTETTTLDAALAWVSVIALAEELLWRGVGLAELQRFIPRRAAVALSLVLYAFAQLGTGSWIVFLVALVCGALWSAERLFTRSLLAPLISHWIWTGTVIILHPLT